jgi:hypothetical protein
MIQSKLTAQQVRLRSGSKERFQPVLDRIEFTHTADPYSRRAEFANVCIGLLIGVFSANVAPITDDHRRGESIIIALGNGPGPINLISAFAPRRITVVVKRDPREFPKQAVRVHLSAGRWRGGPSSIHGRRQVREPTVRAGIDVRCAVTSGGSYMRIAKIASMRASRSIPGSSQTGVWNAGKTIWKGGDGGGGDR